jgi:hypothetical protein
LGRTQKEQAGALVCEKKKEPAKPKAPVKPVVLASAGPEGHKSDCATMTSGQLQAAYKSEYQSWKNSKSRCKKKGWPWASGWESFKDFLLSMGPKPTPAHTLDRVDNAVGAYGPDLCQWADKTAQNNNKSDNKKFVVPLTGEVWTPKKLAKEHSVLPKTVYKWISQHYSILELVAGKKSKSLLALSVALDELTASQPPKGKKVAVRPLKLTEWHYPKPDLDNWHPIEDDWDHYQETGKMRNTHELACKAEYDAVAAWTALVNAGLPYPAFPELKYLKIKPPPPERMAQLHQALPPKPKASPKPAPTYDDEYDSDDDAD